MKKYFIGLIASFGVFGVLQVASPVVNAQFNAAKNQACEGATVVEAGNDCSGEEGGTAISGVLEVALNILSLVAGVIAVIMLIIGGIKFLTSQGDPGSTSSARNTIIYAVVGIVIVAMSQIIVNFVISETNPDRPPRVDVEVTCTPQQAADGLCVAL